MAEQDFVAMVPGRLRVRGEDAIPLVARDAAGAPVAAVLSGPLAGDAHRLLRTAGGAWRLDKPERRHYTLTGMDGAPIADVRRGRGPRSEIVDAGGRALAFGPRGLIVGRRFALADLAVAHKPLAFPQRGFDYDVTAELLARPDGDALAVLGALLGQWAIADAFRDANSGAANVGIP